MRLDILVLCLMMQRMDLQKALEAAQDAATEARKVLLRYYGHLSKVREKGVEGLVSEADIESEKAIGNVLRRAFPEIPILGEEGASETWRDEMPESTWIVDPLDGTTNYVHGFSVFCISIGLLYQGQLAVGVVDVPMLDDRYHAVQGGGAFLNGEPIRVSSRHRLKDSLLATGFFPHLDLEEQIHIFTELVREVRGVRRAGAAAYDLCLVAEGVFDGFWEKNLKPWDVAAGALLVREAGGKVWNYEGEEFRVSHKSVIASNPKLLPQLLSRARKIKKA